jgi:hypothetical protein
VSEGERTGVERSGVAFLEWLPNALSVGAVALMAELMLIRFQLVLRSSTVSCDSSLLGIVENATGNAWRHWLFVADVI